MKKRMLTCLLSLMLIISLSPVACFADILKDDLPKINAESYIVLDGDTHQVLFGNKYDKSFEPGALVQMMTAVLIIEEGNLNDSVVVPEIPDGASQGNRLYLRKGEKITLNQLLEGIIVDNANDAAIAAAVHISGSEKAFISLMNERAKEMGMADTTFKSSYGSVKGQKTTAHDMAILAAYASSLPKYIELAIQPTLDWESEMNQESYTNVNGLQNVDPQAVGLKITQNDTIHLAASRSKSERTIVGIMLGASSADTAYQQMKNIIDIGFESTSIKKMVTKDETVTTLNFGKNKTVRIAPKKNFSVTAASGNISGYHAATVLDKTTLPIKAGEKVGVINIYEGDENIASIDLLALDSAKAPINWKFVIVAILALLYIATILYNSFMRLTKRLSRRPSLPMKKPSSKGIAKPQFKTRKTTPATKSHTAANAEAKSARLKNPSSGSHSGRAGLEQRLQARKGSSGNKYGGKR